jgi:hypothetical protein
MVGMEELFNRILSTFFYYEHFPNAIPLFVYLDTVYRQNKTYIPKVNLITAAVSKKFKFLPT